MTKWDALYVAVRARYLEANRHSSIRGAAFKDVLDLMDSMDNDDCDS